jgi:hypothetical protein
MRATIGVIAILAAFTVSMLWIGTTHRGRCRRAGNLGCSIVPWSGHPAAKNKQPISSIWGDSSTFRGQR